MNNTSQSAQSQKKSSKMGGGSSAELIHAPSTNALQRLNFPNCMINKASSQKFILKNHSGIKTSFLFDVMNYAPLQ